MSNKSIDVNKLRKIKEALPFGAGTKMATEFGVSSQYIYAVLNGQKKSKSTKAIVMRALEIIKESQEQLAEVINN